MTTDDTRRPIRDFGDPWEIPTTHEELQSILEQIRAERTGPNTERHFRTKPPRKEDIQDALLLNEEARNWRIAEYRRYTTERRKAERDPTADPSFGYML